LRRNARNKWLIVGLLFCAAALNYGDRSAITAVFPLLRRDLGMSDVALAAVNSLFLWAYALLSPIAGYLGDRFSRTRLITASLLGWSLATVLTSLSHSESQLLSMRLVLGVVEAGYMPADQIPEAEKGARGIYDDNPQQQRDEAMRSATFGAAAIIYAARSMGWGSTPMIGFDPAAARTEYGLKNNEIPVMLLAVGPMREGNWPSKPRRPVLDVLSFR